MILLALQTRDKLSSPRRKFSDPAKVAGDSVSYAQLWYLVVVVARSSGGRGHQGLAHFVQPLDLLLLELELAA